MIRLEPLDFGRDPEALASEMAHGFGGDTEAPRAIIEQSRDFFAANPRPHPWGSYVAIADGPVALGSFKHGPDESGAVEIAYMTFPMLERRGYAGATIGALVEIAEQGGAKTVLAHTLPEENASNRALRSNGFTFEGDVVDPGDGPVWRWSRRARAVG